MVDKGEPSHPEALTRAPRPPARPPDRHIARLPAVPPAPLPDRTDFRPQGSLPTRCRIAKTLERADALMDTFGVVWEASRQISDSLVGGRFRDVIQARRLACAGSGPELTFGGAAEA